MLCRAPLTALLTAYPRSPLCRYSNPAPFSRKSPFELPVLRFTKTQHGIASRKRKNVVDRAGELPYNDSGYMDSFGFPRFICKRRKVWNFAALSFVFLRRLHSHRGNRFAFMRRPTVLRIHSLRPAGKRSSLPAWRLFYCVPSTPERTGGEKSFALCPRRSSAIMKSKNRKAGEGL